MRQIVVTAPYHRVHTARRSILIEGAVDIIIRYWGNAVTAEFY